MIEKVYSGCTLEYLSCTLESRRKGGSGIIRLDCPQTRVYMLPPTVTSWVGRWAIPCALATDLAAPLCLLTSSDQTGLALPRADLAPLLHSHILSDWPLAKLVHLRLGRPDRHWLVLDCAVLPYDARGAHDWPLVGMNSE